MKKPSVTKTSHLLPFGELSPALFERLCLWLVEREGYLRPEHLGEAGSEQGRDVIAYRATGAGEQLWYFQCKRYQTINAATLIKEIGKYNKLATTDPSKKPFGIVFVTNAALSAKARKEVRGFCDKHGYECEFWARTELDMLVKKYEDIVAEFFNLTAPFGDRLTRIEAKGDRSVVIHGNATGVTIITGDGAIQGAASKPPTLPPAPPQKHISISRLPATGPNLFGREEELQRLDDAWVNPDTNIIAFVAWGGVGKTALVNHWLKKRMARDNYRGADRVYGWSFYSQGTSERAASADLFIDQALRWFGDADPTLGSPWDKGERLAYLIRQTRTLLVLDGLEPLQHPPGPQEGRLKDAALQALLVELAAGQPGLCVISTRERAGDLAEFENGTVLQCDLDHLSPRPAAQLLRAQGVKGDDDELEHAGTEYGGHALALTLLGSYLSDVCGGDVRRHYEIENLEEDIRHGRHAEQVMRAYEKWLGQGVELAVLRLLGLFDRPAEAASIAALRAAPTIPGLTEPLQGLKDREWRQALAKLRRIRLLSEPTADGALDGHPLVREHFRLELKGERPEAWREANNRLYEHLKNKAKEFPDTLEEMSPLYAAVAHGCAAGRHQEAYDDVYRRRIWRGHEVFSLYTLGAFGADLGALSGFFTRPWQHPVSGLMDASKASVLNTAGFALRALGRSQEAAQPMQAALEAATEQRDWSNGAIGAGNLSELYLTTGDLQQALTLSHQSIELADRSTEDDLRTYKRAEAAYLLHQVGRTGEAVVAFRQAEDMQRKGQPQYPLLYSLAGFRYCDVLLDQGRAPEVKERAVQALEIARANNWLLEIALDNLSLGRAGLLGERKEATGDITQAAEFLQWAVSGLRRAGDLSYLPLGLLARAELHRVNGDYSRAERDLAEALRIATRGGMGLHLADCHLESARLQLAQGDRGKAHEHWETAKAMIERMGYHRRDEEVDELAQSLGLEGFANR